MNLEIITRAINEASKYKYIARVGLFGSYARGDTHGKSDVDILIDYDGRTDEFLDDLDNFMEDFEALVHCKIDYVTVPGLMNSRDEEFKQAVLRDVRWIYNAKGA